MYSSFSDEPLEVSKKRIEMTQDKGASITNAVAR